MTQNTKKNLKNDFISLIEQSSEEVVETLINYHPLEKIAHSHMIQYVSTTHMKKLFDDTYEIYEFLLEKDILDRHNKVIDVGCGIGLLKWICRNNGYITYASETYLQSSFSNGLVNFDPYQIVRKYLDVWASFAEKLHLLPSFNDARVSFRNQQAQRSGEIFLRENVLSACSSSSS